VKSVLLEFMTTDNKTIIFVIRQDWEEKGIKDKEPLVFEADFNEQDVVDCVKEIRALYDEWRDKKYKPEYLDKIRLEDRTSFYDIGHKIFNDELMRAIDGYELIYFVPFSALHHLPLHAMRDSSGVDIIDRFACSYLPSASVLQFVNKSKERPKEFNFKGIGVDALNQNSKVFVQEISKIETNDTFFTKKFLITSEEATKDSFFLDNEKFNILHCSAHGYFSNTNPLESSIMLFIPEEHRPNSLEELEKQMNHQNTLLKDYSVSVNELISRLNSSFELVFLSACVSGENKNEAGDELIGLSRGLFYSGTKSMILALFTVDKQITGNRKSNTYIKKFYQFWIEKRQYKAKAFQNYIKIIKEDYKHPFYWFPYILIGNPY